MSRRFQMILSLAMILTATAGCASRTGNREAKVQYVRMQTVMPAAESMLIQYPGRVKASQDVNLAFKVSGNIKKFHVKEGQSIRKGQVLVEMDPSDYQVQLDATQAEYEKVKAEAERVMRLYEEHSVSANDYDKARYGLRQITAKLQHAKDQMEYTVLRAPFDGNVGSVLFDDHELVSQGFPVISVLSSGSPEVEISIPASIYIQKEHFQSFDCTFDIYKDKVFPLEIVSIASKANANQLFTMRLRFTDTSEIRPSIGISTMVTIHTGNQEGLMEIPASALRQQDGRTVVWVVSGDETVSMKEVQVVRLRSNGNCIVSSETLSVGERIVSTGVNHLEVGDRVQSLQEPSQTNVGNLM